MTLLLLGKCLPLRRSFQMSRTSFNMPTASHAQFHATMVSRSPPIIGYAVECVCSEFTLKYMLSLPASPNFSSRVWCSFLWQPVYGCSTRQQAHHACTRVWATVIVLKRCHSESIVTTCQPSFLSTVLMALANCRGNGFCIPAIGLMV